MQFRTLKSVSPQLGYAPLIDVILNLLIFFAISSSFVVQPGFRVELPEATGTPEAPPRDLNVTISADGSVYFGQARTSVAELPELLRSSLAQRRDTGLLVVKADQDVRHGLVVQVLDAAKAAGIVRLAIATRPKGEAP
jgi:biopolymer transport protein ExbD